MSQVYRFHCPVDLSPSGSPALLRKRKKHAHRPLHLIGADTSSISDHHGRRALETYVATEARAVTLTRYEADLIALANPGIAAPEALEDMQPWLPECQFLNNSKASLSEITAVIRRFGQHLISASSFCDDKWNTICNALRQRSVHDARFHSAWHMPIQEAFVLEEARPERNVVAIDFNGMYPSCMQYDFPKPSTLQHVQLDRDHEPNEILPTGLYRCILSEPNTDFIVRYNPLRSFHSGRYLRAKISEPIAIDLNEFEITFYARHFRRIRLVEGVISKETVVHPLAREVRRSFARRQNYRRQGNKALSDREKFLATLMTSCACRPKRVRRTFETLEAAMEYAHSQYGIDVPADEAEAATDIWLDGRKGVKLRYCDDGFELRGPALQDGSACYLLGQRIISRSRIILLEMMEQILASAPNVQICYANIDSIHFSLPTTHNASVLAWLEKEASDAMGSFKIEAATQHGLWLEPGRYWLYSDTDIVKFRNRSVGDRRKPFKDHAIHVATRHIGDLHVPIRMTLNMERTMSPSRSVEINTVNGLSHQKLIEIGDKTIFSDVMEQLERNQRQAIPIRMRAFRALERKMASSRDAASAREEIANIIS